MYEDMALLTLHNFCNLYRDGKVSISYFIFNIELKGDMLTRYASLLKEQLQKHEIT